MTLADLVIRYRDTISIHKRTAANERIGLSAFLRHRICRKTLSELRTEDFAAYRDERLQKISPTGLKRALTPIRNLFRVARMEWGLPLRDSPIEKLKLNAPDQRRQRRLKTAEFDLLRDSARICRNRLILPIVQIALETGMRRSEILAIQTDHIDLKRRVLLIPKSKNGHPRTIPLTAQAAELLRPRLETSDGRLFPMTANAFRLAWERLRRRAGLNDLRFHDLRHEAISRFFEFGLTVPEVASISSHRDARMLFRYAHAATEQIIAKFQAHQRNVSG